MLAADNESINSETEPQAAKLDNRPSWQQHSWCPPTLTAAVKQREFASQIEPRSRAKSNDRSFSLQSEGTREPKHPRPKQIQLPPPSHRAWNSHVSHNSHCSSICPLTKVTFLLYFSCLVAHCLVAHYSTFPTLRLKDLYRIDHLSVFISQKKNV